MNNFEKISIIGRVAYIIASLETYLEKEYDKNKWATLFDALWSFPNYRGCIDDYAYKIIECTPESVLDERADFSTFEYFNEVEMEYFKKIYMESKYTKEIEYFLQQINDILAFNLYTTVNPPEEYSLKIISETYIRIRELLRENTPLISDFEKYSIYDNSCWGNF